MNSTLMVIYIDFSPTTFLLSIILYPLSSHIKRESALFTLESTIKLESLIRASKARLAIH